MEKQNKKLYTQGGFLGYITRYYNNIVYIQPLDGSAIIRGVGKNLTKKCLEGIEDVAFDYFIKNGRFTVQAFPTYRAGNPITSSASLNGVDREKFELNPSFEGTWSEFLALSQLCRELAKTAVAVETPKKEILMLPMVIVAPVAIAVEEPKEAMLMLPMVIIPPIVELSSAELEVNNLEPELEEETLECFDEESEGYDDDGVPYEKFDWDSEEAEEFDGYYDVDSSPKSSHKQWR